MAFENNAASPEPMSPGPAEKRKRTMGTEVSYVLGLLLIAFATALTERAGFGMSMVVAPAYLIHLKVSETLSFFSFGMAEYLLQLVLIIALCAVLRKIRISYLFSFVTAVLYGFALDGFIALVALIPGGDLLPVRIAFFICGMVICSLAVAFFFHTYISPEAYELFVKELAERFRWKTSVCKTVYDCVSCLIAVILSFVFYGFGTFVGVGWGTIVCALINGWLIGLFGRMMERRFVFRDLLPWRKWFEK